MNYKLQMPEGVQDYLPEECREKRALEDRFRRRFLANGYIEIQTPLFEYYDVFAQGIGSIRQEKMIKFFDKQGRILVLRPDITMPIARVAATKLSSKPPFRLFYIGEAFGYDNTVYGEQKEFTQAGIELLGREGPEADAEVIATAILALRDAGLENFQMDIGQVDFFKGLMEEAGIGPADSEKLQEYIEQKNMLSVEMMLRGMKVSAGVRKTITELTTLFGGPEVFSRALSMSRGSRSRRALENLRAVYDILCDFGFGDIISIDLGMLKSIDYYTGVVFRGMTDDLGCPLLTGGRYDTLLDSFGRDMPATGFAIGIKRVLIALERQGRLLAKKGAVTVVSCDPGARKAAFEFMENMRAQGETVESAMQLNESALRQYAADIGAKRAVYVLAGGEPKAVYPEETP